YPPDDVKSGKAEHELTVAEREGRFEDYGWRVRKDGTRFWANVILTALRDADGRLRGFSKVTRDVTARREAEEALRRSREDLERRPRRAHAGDGGPLGDRREGRRRAPQGRPRPARRARDRARPRGLRRPGAPAHRHREPPRQRLEVPGAPRDRAHRARRRRGG